MCGNVRYNTPLYCLAVQAGFHCDAVECLTATQKILVRSAAGTKGVCIFSPVTFLLSPRLCFFIV